MSANLRLGKIEPISNELDSRRLADHAFGLAGVVTVRTDVG